MSSPRLFMDVREPKLAGRSSHGGNPVGNVLVAQSCDNFFTSPYIILYHVKVWSCQVYLFPLFIDFLLLMDIDEFHL